MINKEMTIDVKDLGIINRFNSLDVQQTKHYVKISNETYITIIVNEHPTMFENYYSHNTPIPTPNDKEFAKTIEQAIPPQTPDEKLKLQNEMNFNYCLAVGELIFAMVTCRLDISFPLIKLSQYAQNPAKEHYEAI